MLRRSILPLILLIAVIWWASPHSIHRSLEAVPPAPPFSRSDGATFLHLKEATFSRLNGAGIYPETTRSSSSRATVTRN